MAVSWYTSFNVAQETFSLNPIHTRYHVAEIPSRFQGLTIKSLPSLLSELGYDLADWQDILKLVQSWMDLRFPNLEYGERAKPIPTGPKAVKYSQGLLFTGSSRKGKTLLAGTIASEVAQRGYLSMYKSAQDFYSEKRAATLKNDWMLEADIEALHDATFWLVTLDDVGKERRTGTGFSENAVDTLLRGRYNFSVPTIITTNETEDDWNKAFGSSMSAFMYDVFLVVSLESVSLRKKIR